MPRRRVFVVALTLAILGAVWPRWAAPAAAECMFFEIPPATVAAPTARDVFVGTVIENVGGQLYDFRVRVDHAFRGSARVGDVRRFNFVFPKWPLTALPDGTLIPPCEAIPGWEGDVIAFSLGALAPDGSTRYNAASWISGEALHWGEDVHRTTLNEFASVAGLPPTDVAGSRLSRSDDSLPVWVLGLILGGLVVSLRLARRPHVTLPDAD